MPPQSDAGFDVEAVFRAERLVRRPGFHELLERSRVRRAGPIRLVEARVLGSQLQANAQVTLLGKTLPISQRLAPLVREVLVLLEKPLAVSELLALSQGPKLDKEPILAALTSLVRSGLVLLTSPDVSSSQSATS